jgi:predicted outer membrane repeat protein
MSKRNRTKSVLVGIALVAGVAWVGAPAAAGAASGNGVSFTVTYTGDSGDDNPGDGICADFDGACTLRAAADEINALGAAGGWTAADVSNVSLPSGTISVANPVVFDYAVNLSGPATITAGAEDVRCLVLGNAANAADVGPNSINGVTFKDCSAGAVTVREGATTVTNTTFNHNFMTSNGNGGGIEFRPDAALTITGSTFTKNEADDGGGVYLDGDATLKISSSTFTDNAAKGWGGGAVYSYTGGTITNSTFTGNTAVGGAGAIEVFQDYAPTPVNVTGSTFTNNSGGDGGAIIVYDQVTTVTGSTFTNNSGSVGAAINVYNEAATVTDSTFTNNKATGNEGGAIRIQGANSAGLKVSGSTFTGNQATTNEGGAIFAFESDLTVSASTFTQNTGVNGAGGAISTNGDGNFPVGIHDSQFSKNSGISGGALKTSSSLTITGSLFTDNEATEYGGGAISAGDVAEITGSTIANNTSTTEGGGLELGGPTTITNSTIDGNSSGGSGASAILFPWGTLTLNHVTMIGDGDNMLRDNVSENTIKLNSSILLNGGCEIDGASTLVSDGHNVIDQEFKNGCTSLTDTTVANLAAAHLGPLQLNAPAKLVTTRALIWDATKSPAIDLVPNCTVSTDERGSVRPGANTTLCDAGAYELNPSSPAGSTTPTTAAPSTTAPAPKPMPAPAPAPAPVWNWVLTIFFGTNSSKTANSKGLNQLINWVSQGKVATVRCTGYADVRGSKRANVRLAHRRAASACRKIVGKSNVTTVVQSKGATKIFSRKKFAANRRTEVAVTWR